MSTEAFDSFDYHAPTPEQLETITAMREAAKAMRAQLEALPIKSRALSLALTNLEQALMWANKAVFQPH